MYLNSTGAEDISVGHPSVRLCPFSPARPPDQNTTNPSSPRHSPPQSQTFPKIRSEGNRPSMENGAPQNEGRDPSGFLSQIIGNAVTVKLNSGVVYKGELEAAALALSTSPSPSRRSPWPQTQPTVSRPTSTRAHADHLRQASSSLSMGT